MILLVYPEARLLDVAGLLQVFRDARGPDGAAPFRVQMVSGTGGPVETDAGVALLIAPCAVIGMATGASILQVASREALQAAMTVLLLAVAALTISKAATD